MVAEALAEGVRLVLAVPTTYMNDSGRALSSLTHFYKIEPASLIVVHDDVDLPLGALRVKKGGGSAGHHGIESIVAALGTNDFFRVRIGVGRPVSDQLVPPDFLLESTPKDHSIELRGSESKAAEAVLSLVHHGLEKTMNRFNSVPRAES